LFNLILTQFVLLGLQQKYIISTMNLQHLGLTIF